MLKQDGLQSYKMRKSADRAKLPRYLSALAALTLALAAGV
jgi:hypothetical protein